MNKIILWIRTHIVQTAVTAVILLGTAAYLYIMWAQGVHYDWDDDNMFLADSDAPFGSLYFDEYMKSRCEAGYAVAPTMKEVMDSLPKGKSCNIILTRRGWQMYGEQKLIDKVLKRGCRLLVHSYGTILDEAPMPESFYTFDINKFKNGYPPTEIHLSSPDGRLPATPIIQDFLDKYYMDVAEEDAVLRIDSTSRDRGDYVFVWRLNRHKGTVVFCGIGAALTNYALSDSAMMRVTEHLLNESLDPSLPTYRVTQTLPEKAERRHERYDSDSRDMMDLAFIMEHKPLAAMVWILLAAILLGIAVNCRRRQAASPLPRRQRNSMVSYIRHLATIYGPMTDYRGLVITECRVLLHTLRSEFRFSPGATAFTSLADFAPLIAQRSGMDADQLRERLQAIESRNADISHRIGRKDYVRTTRFLRSLTTS